MGIFGYNGQPLDYDDLMIRLVEVCPAWGARIVHGGPMGACVRIDVEPDEAILYVLFRARWQEIWVCDIANGQVKLLKQVQTRYRRRDVVSMLQTLAETWERRYKAEAIAAAPNDIDEYQRLWDLSVVVSNSRYAKLLPVPGWQM